MAFRNPPIAGLYLVRPALRSPNYISGSQGWTINRDGTVELNFGTFRGAVITNSLNGPDSSELSGGSLSFFDEVNPPESRAGIDGISDTTRAFLELASGRGSGNGDANLILYDSASSPDGISFILAQTKIASNSLAPPISGSVIQTDTNNSSNNVFHADVYNVTVVGTTGMATFNHNCKFTPKGGVVGPLTHFTQWNWSVGTSSFTSTQAQITVYQPSGAALTNGSPASFCAVFWG